MGKTKKKSKKAKNHHKYGNDVIAYYANKNTGTLTTLDWCTAEDVHTAAVEVFGTSYYVDFQNL